MTAIIDICICFRHVQALEFHSSFPYLWKTPNSLFFLYTAVRAMYPRITPHCTNLKPNHASRLISWLGIRLTYHIQTLVCVHLRTFTAWKHSRFRTWRIWQSLRIRRFPFVGIRFGLHLLRIHIVLQYFGPAAAVFLVLAPSFWWAFLDFDLHRLYNLDWFWTWQLERDAWFCIRVPSVLKARGSAVLFAFLFVMLRLKL